VLKKCKKPDDVLFINAAEHFTKGKRQNQLGDGSNGTPDHIGKIIETYQFRKEEDRYSKRVSMERIAEEGFNLNISRYISTAEQEPEIDLLATHEALVDIETQINMATRKYNEFLQQLELPPLPLLDQKNE
jgi:type I restriction enzyme M protein